MPLVFIIQSICVGYIQLRVVGFRIEASMTPNSDLSFGSIEDKLTKLGVNEISVVLVTVPNQ